MSETDDSVRTELGAWKRVHSRLTEILRLVDSDSDLVDRLEAIGQKATQAMVQATHYKEEHERRAETLANLEETPRRITHLPVVLPLSTTVVSDDAAPEDDSQVEFVRRHVAGMLSALDPSGPREGTDDTPTRVARMYLDELCIGYYQRSDEIMRLFPSEGYGGMIIVKDIPVVSLCEHHLVPFVGFAHVGYFPGAHVVGLSKIPRLVNMHARRLQIQERLTESIAHDLEANLSPRGVIVAVEAEHMCMTIRGVQAPGTKTFTSAVRGLFEENHADCKTEFLRLVAKS